VHHVVVDASYDGIAAQFEKHAVDGAYNAHYDRPAMLDLIGDVAGRRILDVGCGPGFYAEELVRRGAEVVAIDTSPKMLTLARRRLKGRAVLQQADLAGRLPFPDQDFDDVVCALVIHHLADREAALREIYRVLRPGGRLLLSTTHPTMDWLRKGGSYFAVQQEVDIWGGIEGGHPSHFWREPLTSLCAAATNAGFLIAVLLEPTPAESMRSRWPEDWEQLHREPGFLVLSLVKVAQGD